MRWVLRMDQEEMLNHKGMVESGMGFALWRSQLKATTDREETA